MLLEGFYPGLNVLLIHVLHHRLVLLTILLLSSKHAAQPLEALHRMRGDLLLVVDDNVAPSNVILFVSCIRVESVAAIDNRRQRPLLRRRESHLP